MINSNLIYGIKIYRIYKLKIKGQKLKNITYKKELINYNWKQKELIKVLKIKILN